MKKNQILWGVVILIVVAGGAFYGGMTYAQGQSTAAVATRTTGAGGFAGRTGTRTGGGFTGGQIVSSTNGSISILQQNGSSTEIVLISPTTQILKSVTGSASDLTVGTNVTVTGTTNSDGSLTASAIQLRPAGMNFPGRPPTTPAATQ